MTRVRLDDLLGSTVHDQEGRAIGRIYEMRAEKEGDDVVVVEYHIGARALLERVGLSLLTLVGLRRGRDPIKVRWERLDISDPSRPLFLGSRDELL